MKFDYYRYHRCSVRLKEYDYSQPGAYFVTVCTRNRESLFGEISNGSMKLNNFGKIAQECSEDLPNHSLSVRIDTFVVMPNHVHAIVFLANDGGGTACRAPTLEQFGKPIPGTLGTIRRSLKAAVSRQINQLLHTPGLPIWQRNYYEHVIRKEESLDDIRQYIIENPLRWTEDEENPTNISLQR